jgi:phytanoyl-CoA hydroxylase
VTTPFTEQQETEWVGRFRSDGYLYLPGFLQAHTLESVETALARLIREQVPHMPPSKAFYEDPADPSTLKQIQALYEHDPQFHALMFGSRLEALARILLDDDVAGRNMQYFNKPPRTGLPTPAHQDGYYFMLDPCEALTMWLGLDSTDEANGCVRYVPGSHLEGMRPHGRTRVLGFSQGITDYDSADAAREVWFRTRPGDLLVHHALTIHRADGNTSQDRNRRALGFIYYADRAREDTLRKQAYQQALQDDLDKSARRSPG